MLLFITTIEDDIIRSKLEIIFEKYSGAMYGRAYAILENVSDAEDAVSDAFIRLFKNVDKINDPASLETKGFAVIIAEHCAIDIYRKRKRLNESELDENITAIPGNIEYVGDDKITAELFKLSSNYRNVLILKYVQGYEYPDIAKMLDISEENARKTGQRAKAKLEVLCREQGLIC